MLTEVDLARIREAVESAVRCAPLDRPLIVAPVVIVSRQVDSAPVLTAAAVHEASNPFPMHEQRERAAVTMVSNVRRLLITFHHEGKLPRKRRLNAEDPVELAQYVQADLLLRQSRAKKAMEQFLAVYGSIVSCAVVCAEAHREDDHLMVHVAVTLKESRSVTWTASQQRATVVYISALSDDEADWQRVGGWMTRIGGASTHTTSNDVAAQPPTTLRDDMHLQTMRAVSPEDVAQSGLELRRRVIRGLIGVMGLQQAPVRPDDAERMFDNSVRDHNAALQAILPVQRDDLSCMRALAGLLQSGDRVRATAHLLRHVDGMSITMPMHAESDRVAAEVRAKGELEHRRMAVRILGGTLLVLHLVESVRERLENGLARLLTDGTPEDDLERCLDRVIGDCARLSLQYNESGRSTVELLEPTDRSSYAAICYRLLAFDHLLNGPLRESLTELSELELSTIAGRLAIGTASPGQPPLIGRLLTLQANQPPRSWLISLFSRTPTDVTVFSQLGLTCPVNPDRLQAIGENATVMASPLIRARDGSKVEIATTLAVEMVTRMYRDYYGPSGASSVRSLPRVDAYLRAIHRERATLIPSRSNASYREQVELPARLVHAAFITAHSSAREMVDVGMRTAFAAVRLFGGVLTPRSLEYIRLFHLWILDTDSAGAMARRTMTNTLAIGCTSLAEYMACDGNYSADVAWAVEHLRRLR